MDLDRSCVGKLTYQVSVVDDNLLPPSNIMFYADTMDECAKLCYDRGHGCKAAVFQMLPKRVAPKGGPCSAVRHPWKLGLTCQSKVGWPVNKTVPDFSSKLRSHILTCIECPDSDGDRKDRMNITPPEWHETMDETTRPMLTAKPARAHKKMTVVRPKWPKKPTSRKPLHHDNRTRAGMITVMTFNTTAYPLFHRNGLAKVAKYINMVNADIVGIQENVRGDEIDTLMRLTNSIPDVGMHQEVYANDTLIVIVLLKNYALDHVFAKSRLHCNYHWAMGIDDGTVGDFDLATYRELE
uniref:Apple domain-containing protein n=1 Tax=Romanomermis culicivorax TaxID=13658 RepID=A0A915KWC7_ROMCU